MAVSNIPLANRTAYKQGTGNNFSGYPDQCTWWASERYHQMTGIWVPWIGNAYQWASNAANDGWVVSDKPPKGLPSIICLQPYAGQGLLGAGTIYGHVGIVEGVNSDGTVRTSNENWGVGPILGYVGNGQYPIRQVTFRTGNGVSFIYASETATGNQSNGSITSTIASAVKNVSLSPNADVTQFLVQADAYLQLNNPFDVPDVQKDNILGTSFNDPVDYLEKLTNNLFMDARAILLRSILLMLGFFVLYKVLSHFVDFAGIAKETGSTISQLLPLLGA